MSQPKVESIASAASDQLERSPSPSGAAATTGESVSNGALALMADAVREDHADLDRIAARLREVCAALRNGQAAADAQPVGLIEEYEDLLIAHFAAEQAEEFFGSLMTDQPSLLQRVEHLQDEHGKLAEALEQLLEFAKNGPPGSDLAVRIRAFLDRFDTHEDAENALMEEFIVLDQRGEGE